MTNFLRFMMKSMLFQYASAVADMNLLIRRQCCDSCKVTRSSNTIGVQLQVIQYVFQIKTLSRVTPGSQTRDWLKNKRENEVEICSMSMTKYGKYE